MVEWWKSLQGGTAGKQKRVRPAAGVLSALVLLAGFTWYENRTIQTQTFRLRAPNLPQAFSAMRVVQISDLHGEIFGENSARLLAAVQDATPDLIAVTGDLADEYTDFSMLRPLVSGLCAIAPVCYVTGNHEARLEEDFPRLLSGLRDAGVTVLRDESILLERGDAPTQRQDHGRRARRG